MMDRDTARARILVILTEAGGKPLPTGYAARRITAEVVEPMLAEVAEAERRGAVKALRDAAEWNEIGVTRRWLLARADAIEAEAVDRG